MKLGNFEFTDLKSGKRGRPIRVYLLNETQVILLIIFLDNTELVVDFKLELVQQFYHMWTLLIQKQSIQWQQACLVTKDMRKLETAEIKELVQYAQTQGSRNAKKYYLALSKLANKMIGLSGGQREQASVTQLNRLTLVENIIHHVIQEGIEKQLPYKQIYQICKARPEQFKKLYISRTNFKKVLDK